MQIGIDLGATKIESVVLLDDGTEKYRERVSSPNNYEDTINSIEKLFLKLRRNLKKKSM